VYSLNPTDNNVCRYTYAGGSTGSYIHYHNGAVWVGDVTMDAVVKIDPTLNQVSQWTLSTGSLPDAMRADSSGNIWFTQQGTAALAPGARAASRQRSIRREPRQLPARPSLSALSAPAIGRLDPTTGALTNYFDPMVATPMTVVPNGTEVWYTAINWDTTQSFVGNLAPGSVAGTPGTTVAVPTAAVTVNCSTVTPAVPTAVTTATGTITWATTPYTQIGTALGYSIYRLPVDGNAWGLALLQNEIWLADQGRQVLATNLTITTSSTFLPMILKE
jgi:streptogramin lyase